MYACMYNVHEINLFVFIYTLKQFQVLNTYATWIATSCNVPMYANGCIQCINCTKNVDATNKNDDLSQSALYLLFMCLIFQELIGFNYVVPEKLYNFYADIN